MGYDYQTERPKLFTEEGQVKLLEVRDKAKTLLAKAGAFRLDALMDGISGDSWQTMACVERLVELKELVPLRAAGSCWAQYQVYSTPEVHNR